MQVDPNTTPSLPIDDADSPILTAPSSHLAPELLAMIMDHFRKDFPTLRTCSVVCASWLPVARYHLFNSIHVECEDESWDHLIDRITNSTPSVTDSIREIHISSRLQARKGRGGPLFEIVNPYLLAYLLDHLEHLHTIVLERVCWDNAMGPEEEDLLSRWPPVPRPLKTLRLVDITSREVHSRGSHSYPSLPEKRIGLLQLFTCIEQLDIKHTGPEVFLRNLAGIPAGMVQGLTLRSCKRPVDVLNSLSRLGALNHLASLSIDVPVSQPEEKTCFKIIYDASPTLRSLYLALLGTPEMNVGEMAARNQLQLTEHRFPSLLSLGFEVQLGSLAEYFPFVYDWHGHLPLPIADIKRNGLSIWSYIINLSQLGPPPLVKSLTVKHNITISYSHTSRQVIRMNVHQEGYIAEIFGSVDWQKVTSALNGWSNLEEVCIHLKVRLIGFDLKYGKDRKVEDTLRECLEGLSPSIRLVLRLDPPTR